MVPLSSALVHAYLGRTLPQTLSVSATREGGLADSQGLVRTVWKPTLKGALHLFALFDFLEAGWTLHAYM